MLTATEDETGLFKAFCQYGKPELFDAHTGAATDAQALYNRCLQARYESTDPLYQAKCGWWGNANGDLLGSFGAGCTRQLTAADPSAPTPVPTEQCWDCPLERRRAYKLLSAGALMLLGTVALTAWVS